MGGRGMSAALLTEWQRLILPPAGVPVRAGEQLRTGNAYPNADTPDWPAHLDGRRTYAVNLAWTGPQGGALCKAAVLDIDEGPASLGKAAALLAVARAGGLSCLPSWSGSKGLSYVAILRPGPGSPGARGAGEAAGGGRLSRAKRSPATWPASNCPPPCIRRRVCWALWLDTLPDTPPALDNAPTGFLDAQAAHSRAVTPSPVAVLERFAGTATQTQRPNAPENELEPALDKLAGALPSCIAALVDAGAQTTLGTWDKNSLTLARYCTAANIPPEPALALVKTLSDNTGPDFETGKDGAARLKHWDSIHEPGPFSCGFILPAKRALRFDCWQCAARPAGVRAGAGGSAAHGKTVADALMNGPDLDTLLADLPETARNRALSLRDALANIPPDAGLGKHSAATTIGFGLCHEFDGGDVGAALCAEWDKRTGGKAAASVYAKADPDYAGKGQPVTADSIFKLARNAGWKPAKPETKEKPALFLEPALADTLLAMALATRTAPGTHQPGHFPR